MILDLREFETFPAHVVLQGNPDELAVTFEEIHGIKAVEVELTIQQTGEEQFYCTGEVRADTTLECARCLGEFTTRLIQEIDFIACTEDDRLSEAGEADDEDYAIFKSADKRADIGPLVTQAIVLALDLKPLCDEACKGLCSQCGVNRNETTCGCKTEQIDPRWEQLKNLLNK